VNRLPQTPASTPITFLLSRLDAAHARVDGWLVRRSVLLLRLSVGAVFLVFGLLKLVPDASPAASLSAWTVGLLTFGLVPAGVAIVLVGLLECAIGVCLLAGRWMRLGVTLLAAAFVGILSPLVLLSGDLFTGPFGAPNLTGQYVLKDVVLVAAGLVIAATLRGGRLRPAPAQGRGAYDGEGSPVGHLSGRPA
jgi:uncharacterized membrane protein YphA (DoxX/SURF4 family)